MRRKTTHPNDNPKEPTMTQTNTDYGKSIIATRHYNDAGKLTGGYVAQAGWTRTGNLYTENEIMDRVRELGGTEQTICGQPAAWVLENVGLD